MGACNIGGQYSLDVRRFILYNNNNNVKQKKKEKEYNDPLKTFKKQFYK